MNFFPFASVPVRITARDFPSFATVIVPGITILPSFIAVVLLVRSFTGL